MRDVLAYLLEEELGLLTTTQRVAHLHLDLLTRRSGTHDVSLALAHTHELSNERGSLALEEDLVGQGDRKRTFPSEVSKRV